MTGIASTSSAARAPWLSLEPPEADWAYFLDFDGTLVEIASSPNGVRTDSSLRALIDHLVRASNGAVALITGRTIADVDRFFPEQHLAVAGQHGMERRDAHGVRTSQPITPPAWEHARVTLLQIAARHPGLLVEDKGLSLAVHYRSAPALASFAHRTLRRIQHTLGDDYAVQAGKRVVELKPAGRDKGKAVLEFMMEAPFRGRRPVFVGDDITDEHGFAVVNQLGGISVKVGRGSTAAVHRLRSVNDVREWLAGAAGGAGSGAWRSARDTELRERSS